MEFRLLGRLEVTAVGVDLTPTRPQQRALLTYLLLRAGEIISTDDLVDALWGERPPETAQTALHGHISALRKRLGAERIETRPPGYLLRLAHPEELDIRRFERLVAEARSEDPAARSEALQDALALFRGEPLADFRFDAFASQEAARLEELRLAVLEQQIEADLELGRHMAVIPQLEQLIGDHPLRERLRAQLMLALYRAGRQAEALHIAQEARRMLVAELGVDPGPALQRLEHQILNHDPQLAAPEFLAPARHSAIPTKPVGIVTFLVTDLEGSTRQLAEPGDTFDSTADKQRELVRTIIGRHGGFEVDVDGSSVRVAFARARDAAASAAGIQHAARLVGVRVRIGIHSAEALGTDEGYTGPGPRGATHICRAARGGQIVISQATRDLLRETPLDEADVLDLGEHSLTDLGRAQRLFQLVSPALDSEFPPLRSLETRTTNLPVQPTALVGRAREIEEIADMFGTPDVRLVTLTGAGGTGKTRLAVHVAAELLDDFVDGVFFVGLAPLADPDLVVPTIARTLGIHEAAGQPVAETLSRHLRDLRLLLVLDNFEHVLAAGPAIAAIVANAPGLKLLVTSRTSLRLAAERVYRVSPLEMPDGADGIDRVVLVDSVALFALRARAVRPEFTVTADNAQAVAGICRALDGLPLAIELAAARTSVLPPESLLARLDRRLKVLTAGARGGPDRHGALQTAIDWSYDLLEPEQRALFARLGVFAGGCALGAAESVCGDGLDVIDGLASLVDHSLLQLEGTDAAPRFAMLETIREYAVGRLETSGEAEGLRLRHAQHYLALAEEAEPYLRGSPGDWPGRLEREHDNLRAALDRLEAAGERERALQLAGALWRFWYLRGYLTEGRRRLERALQGDGRHTAARGKALIGAAVMAVNGDDMATAVLRAEEGLALHRTLGDAWGGAYCQFMLGAAVGDGDLTRAQQLYEESARTFRELGDEHSALLVTRNLASTYGGLGEHDRARELYEDNLRRARATDNERIQASTLGALAMIAFDQGRIQDAIWMLKESLRIHRHLGDRLDTAVDLCRAARTVAFAGRAGTAARLLSSFAAMREEIGVRRSSVAEMNEETLTTVRRQLDEAAFAEAWRRGQGLTVDEAVALALDALD
jgi:Predicted ATPase